jgi:hypothetical protein
MIGSFSRIVNFITMTVVAGTGTAGVLGEGGGALSAEMHRPRGLGFDRTKANLYIADSPNPSSSAPIIAGRILKMNLNTRILTRVAGDPSKGTALTGTGIVTSVAGDATSVTYTLSVVHTFTVGQSVRITDMPSGKEYLNLTGLITSVSPEVNPTTVTLARTGGTVETLNLLSLPVTGLNAPASIGTLAVNAGIVAPYGTVTDSNGNIYFPNQYFGNACILKIDTDGYISRYAGNGQSGSPAAGFNVDRLNTTVRLGNPRGLAIDSNNNIYTAETESFIVRKIDAVTRRITLLVGTLSSFPTVAANNYPKDGDLGTSVRLRSPSGLAIDPAGLNLYIMDTANTPEYMGIYRYNFLTGQIYVILQSVVGYSGDGGPARNAQIQQARNLVFDDLGNMYIPDSNGGIRKIDTNNIITTYTDRARSYGLEWGIALKTPEEIYVVNGSRQVLVTTPYSRYV